MFPYLIVFVGAGIGGALRHGVNLLAARLVGTDFPYGTLAINAVGSFAMAMTVAFLAFKSDLPQEVRLFLTTGVMGGFTTFSAFSLETVLLYERGALGAAALYVILSVVLSVGALFVGLAFGRTIFA
jgi:CrcB protein